MMIIAAANGNAVPSCCTRILTIATLALSASTSAHAYARARVVDRYTVTWATPRLLDAPHYIPVNRPSPPTGPYVGNGDVSLLYSGNGTAGNKHAQAVLDWQQWLYMSKNDMWGSDQTDYYPHLSAGRVGIQVSVHPSNCNGTRVCY